MKDNFSSTSVVKIDHNAVKEAQYDLPQTYGVTESYLLPKDPAWMFLFWDIANDTVQNIKEKHGQDIFEVSRSIIRVYDITEIKNFNGKNAHAFFDISVVLEAKSWYINAPQSARKYICDIALITREGKFILLSRSNATTLPPGKMSSVIDEKWMMVEGEYQKLLKMSGAEVFGAGSSEKLHHFLTQKWKMFDFENYRNPSSHVSSWGSSSSLAKMPSSQEAASDDIWLKADCELIVYGQASKNAKVYISGNEISLNEDGGFSLRYSLGEGGVVIPIKAAQKNKEHNQRSITIKAQRQKEA